MMRNRISKIIVIGVVSSALLAACTMPGMHNGMHNGQMGQGGMGEGKKGQGEMGQGMGMGGNGGMMRFHQATIPAEYAGKTNPVKADETSIERGADLYQKNCTTCHGDGGMGDGATGKTLVPTPAPIAHTSQMMGDDYLFWRISEGGVPFSTAMPAWKEALDEQSRWDLINYMRALGSGQAQPRKGMGGAAYDPATELANRSAMLTKGVEQKIITQAEADTFMAVHAAMDSLLAERPNQSGTGNMQTRQKATLAALVEAKTITQEQADNFSTIHQKLIDAGLMQ